MSQLDLLTPAPTVPPHRVRVVAEQLAGMSWPGHGSFDRLPKSYQQLALDIARSALETLATEPKP